MSQRIDVETTETSHKGLKGAFESVIRRFKTAGYLGVLLPLYLFVCVIFGTALTPGVFFFQWMQEVLAHGNIWVKNLGLGFSLAVGYFMYGFSLMALTALANTLLRAKLSEWRGPYYSAEALKWFIHNGLTYLVRFTFLEFATPSPLNVLYYKMMGMKIGRGTVINSTWISDPSMIELGNRVTIGGSVTMVAHYGQGGLLIIAPIKIGDGCTIGLKSSLMGGAVIGDNAKILPHSVVLPKTVVPAGETWGGVPAQKIESKKPLDSANASALKIA
jgi:carbonic anhydrase/acetyltransferase-like protein (isoleucine patch superfamily)